MSCFRTLFVLLLLLGAQLAGAATLLVANKSAASLSLFDADTLAPMATLPTGEGPHEVAVSPDGRRALVTNYGTREQAGASLTLVDIAAAKVLATIALAGASRPHGVEWLDDGRAVVTAEGIRALLLVDVDAGIVTSTIAVDQEVAHMVALAADGGRAFVANIGSGTASVVDLKAGRKIRDLTSGDGTEGIAIARQGAELWLTNREEGSLRVFSAAALQELATIDLPGFPIRAEADDPRGLLYVTLPKDDALAVVDVARRAERSRIEFDIPPDPQRKSLFGDRLPNSSIPVGVLLSGDGSTLYIAHTSANVVSVYDAPTLRRRALLQTDLEPDGMAWSPVAVRRGESAE